MYQASEDQVLGASLWTHTDGDGDARIDLLSTPRAASKIVFPANATT